MLKPLSPGDVAWIHVERSFAWASPEPRTFMTIAEVCRLSGFEPTPGDGISVSGFLRRIGVQRVKFRGERGALMPPCIAIR